jgi:Ca2+-binding EF-hand superfamily protein
MSESELVQIISKNNKIKDIFRTIYEIDRQHNGFITTTELDDILKLNYKSELANRDLRLIMRKYASIQNRVLVDYKKFRDSIIDQVKKLEEK